jgi:hypothetical protein
MSGAVATLGPRLARTSLRLFAVTSVLELRNAQMPTPTATTTRAAYKKTSIGTMGS